MRAISVVISYSLLVLVSACSSAPPRQATEVFEDQRIVNPFFKSAQACLRWLDQQQRLPATEADPKTFGEQLIVTSWNAQKSSGQRWEDEIHGLVEASDILLLQEAAIIPAKQEVLPHSFVAVTEAFYSWLGPTGLLSASHVEPLASCTFLEREPLLRTRKASNVLLFSLPNREKNLLVINIHSINFSMGLGVYSRQMEQLEQVAAGHDGPVIFAGDLNTWNQRRVDLVDEIAARLRLEEVGFIVDDRVRFLGRPLDRIYFRGLNLLEARTMSSATSDHDPLIAVWDLTLPD